MPSSLSDRLLCVCTPSDALLSQAAAFPAGHRFARRIFLSFALMTSTATCTGDLLLLRPKLRNDGIATLLSSSPPSPLASSLSAPAEHLSPQVLPSPPRFAVGLAWPAPHLDAGSVILSLDHLLSARIKPGDFVSLRVLPPILSPLPSASPRVQLSLPEAKSIVLEEVDPNQSRQFLDPTIQSSPLQPPQLRHPASAVNRLWEGFVRQVLIDRKLVSHQHHISVPASDGTRCFCVSDIQPLASVLENAADPRAPELYIISRNTRIEVRPLPPTAPQKSVSSARVRSTEVTPDPLFSDVKSPGNSLLSNNVGFEAIGGLESQVNQIRELVELPLTRPELYSHFGLTPPRGILLYGPPGTGKTLLASAVANSLHSTLFTLSASSLSSSYHGEAEQRVYDLFAEAKVKSPSVIVIDEIDGLFPNRDQGGEVDRRVVGAMLSCMDGLDEKLVSTSLDPLVANPSGPPRVVVIATTNRPNSLDPALRRPGRFDRELEIGIPDARARMAILQVALRGVPHRLTFNEIKSFADKTHGYVGADLVSLIRNAGLAAIRRSVALRPLVAVPEMRLEVVDVDVALLTTRPSAMRQVFIETPKVSWDQIGGQAIIKQKLRESIEWPMLYPDTLKRLGIKPTRGVLLYGPPGCSKTLIAKALATESGLNFISMKGSEIFNKYVGESEKSIRDLFRKARAASPSVVFLDEIDTIAVSRSSDSAGNQSTGDRVLTSLLTEMDGIEELTGVLVLAATNRPDVIDSALMRPGRLDRILYVGPPDLPSRKEILAINFKNMSIGADVDVDVLAECTEGCTGAEIVSVCQEAAIHAMHRDLDAQFVAQNDFLEAALSVRRQTTPEVVEMYVTWRDRCGARSI